MSESCKVPHERYTLGAVAGYDGDVVAFEGGPQRLTPAYP